MRPAWVVAAALLGAAPSLEGSFPPGSGSRFVLRLGDAGPEVDLAITVAKVQGRRLWVEYFLGGGLVPTELWQQFELDVPERGAARVVAGYVEHASLGGVERIPDSLLAGSDTLGLDVFLAAPGSAPGVDELGTDEVSVPAGTVTARHLRRRAPGRELHFWVSDDAKPLGLVRMASSGRRPGETWTVELAALARNVKARIDPARARPASDALKGILARDGLR